jgi:hypothetical protein
MADSNGHVREMQSDPLSALLERRLGDGQAALPDDDVSRRNLPVLWSFLTRRDAAGNLSKEPAAVTIRLGLGSWLVTLSDPSLEVSLTACASALSSCLEQLEAAARSPYAAWSPWRRSKGKFEKVNKPTP